MLYEVNRFLSNLAYHLNSMRTVICPPLSSHTGLPCSSWNSSDFSDVRLFLPVGLCLYALAPIFWDFWGLYFPGNFLSFESQFKCFLRGDFLLKVATFDLKFIISLLAHICHRVLYSGFNDLLNFLTCFIHNYILWAQLIAGIQQIINQILKSTFLSFFPSSHSFFLHVSGRCHSLPYFS